MARTRTQEAILRQRRGPTPLRHPANRVERCLEGPDSTHHVRAPLVAPVLRATPVATADDLGPRVDRIELGRTPIVEVPETTYCRLIEVQLVQLIPAGQIPVAIATFDQLITVVCGT